MEYDQPEKANAEVSISFPLVSLRNQLYQQTQLKWSDRQIQRLAQGGFHALMWEDASVVLFGIALAYMVSLSFRPSSYADHQTSLPLVFLVGVLIVGSVAYYMFSQLTSRTILARKLPTSDLSRRLAAGPFELSDFVDAVPFPWNLVYARRTVTMKQALDLVLRNAMWFLRPRSPYVNPAWILKLIGIAVFVLGFCIMLVDPVRNPSGWMKIYSDNMLVVGCLPNLGLLLIFSAEGTERSSRRITAAYLKEAIAFGDYIEGTEETTS